MKNKKTVIFIILVVIVCTLACWYFYSKHQIKEYREQALAQIEQSYDSADYRDAENKVIDKYVISAQQEIAGLEDSESMDKVSKETIEKIDKVKTKKEIKQEQLKKERERQKKEAEEAAAAARAQASNSKKSSGSKGCVGSGAENFY